MRRIEELLHEYGLSHQNPTNKLIHWICVPAIFFSIVGLVFSIPTGPLPEYLSLLGSFANWATIALFLVLVYYITLSAPLALGMFLFSAICLALANFLSIIFPGKLWLISLGIFCHFMDYPVLWTQNRGQKAIFPERRTIPFDRTCLVDALYLQAIRIGLLKLLFFSFFCKNAFYFLQ